MRCTCRRICTAMAGDVTHHNQRGIETRSGSGCWGAPPSPQLMAPALQFRAQLAISSARLCLGRACQHSQPSRNDDYSMSTGWAQNVPRHSLEATGAPPPDACRWTQLRKCNQHTEPHECGGSVGRRRRHWPKRATKHPHGMWPFLLWLA